ncbi:hypothetical protein [Legionella tucsonensis]|uniref:Uncharacterized protein n=1 Tax=Legionella tucsonensis TaxID=40335 RepID=A0A0W0ZTN7_9GAMM|nr:hypothetical protein [Legionella tucsonensis]KTD72540.1 hypothetical protein Ltuc_0387 [Legionella tucsonensis]
MFLKVVKHSAKQQVKQSHKKSQVRHFWTRHDENRDFYRHKKQEKLVIDTHFFSTSTLRGQKVFAGEGFSIFNFLMNAFSQGFLFRGMSIKEERDQINQDVHGLAGSKPLIVYKEGTKEIDVAATQEVAKQHRKGDVSGISTSMKLGVGISFANYLPKKTHAVYVVDRNNIPQSQQVNQDYEDDICVTDCTGEPQNYCHERELTVSGVHVSAIPMRVSREGLKLNIECNPFYVDRVLLSEELNKEYDDLLHAFYDVIYDVRRNQVEFTVIKGPDPEKLEKFKAQEKEFYTKLVKEVELDPRQKRAIKDKLDESSLLALEDDNDTTPKNI